MEIQSEYNSVPVLYCKHCLSLRVMNVPMLEDSDYCDECGSTNIEECHIDDWSRFYKNRFGYNYLDSYNKNH